MRTVAVIGKCFGDEGKGLAVDFFSRHAQRPLVVRHNGGAQSGHTVERKGSGGKRFVFHELSAGSFCGADALWIDSFYPDLYKLGEEIESFRALHGSAPRVFSLEETCVTVPDDVLLNMALEASRGEKRHGSCGMGINECDLRTQAGYGLSVQSLKRMDADGLYRALSRVRHDYTDKRLREIGGTLNAEADAYVRLLSDDNVLRNAAEAMIGNLRYVTVLPESALRDLPDRTDCLVFESGQGLLLDRGNEEYAPHVTASDTGLRNPCAFLRRIGRTLDEVVYVSRAYVTRHGAGTLHGECSRASIGSVQRDRTNETNAWQGSIRYACHPDAAGFVADVKKDLQSAGGTDTAVSLFLTHLNETDGCVVTRDRRIPAEEFIALPQIRETFDTVYFSDSRWSEDVRTVRSQDSRTPPAEQNGSGRQKVR